MIDWAGGWVFECATGWLLKRGEDNASAVNLVGDGGGRVR